MLGKSANKMGLVGRIEFHTIGHERQVAASVGLEVHRLFEQAVHDLAQQPERFTLLGRDFLVGFDGKLGPMTGRPRA